MELAVADLARVETDQPGARGDADDLVLRKERAQIQADVVQSIGGVIDLVVHAQHRAVFDQAVLDVLARLDRPNPVLAWRLDGYGNPILRAEPELHLVFGDVHDAVADDHPFQVAYEPRGWDDSA